MLHFIVAASWSRRQFEMMQAEVVQQSKKQWRRGRGGETGFKRAEGGSVKAAAAKQNLINSLNLHMAPTERQQPQQNNNSRDSSSSNKYNNSNRNSGSNRSRGSNNSNSWRRRHSKRQEVQPNTHKVSFTHTCRHTHVHGFTYTHSLTPLADAPL